jgi:hypothetical protein
MAKKINLDDFREKGVCSDGFMHFAAAFGHEIEVTEEACRRMAGKLNFAFGASVFLNEAQQREYLRVVAASAAEAGRLLAESREQYDREFKVSQDLQRAVEQREERDAPIRRAHQITEAIEFARCYNLEIGE